MQLLYGDSEEGGDVHGLALLPGRVYRLPSGLKVPHMGWNQLMIRRPSPLLDGVEEGTHVYFVHSYVVDAADPATVVAATSYGIEFPAIVQHARITGLQFHPEKSGPVGLRLLRNAIASGALDPSATA
jgi:glutamine amidotransferase